MRPWRRPSTTCGDRVCSSRSATTPWWVATSTWRSTCTSSRTRTSCRAAWPSSPTCRPRATPTSSPESLHRRRPGLGTTLGFLVPAHWRTRREIDRWLVGHRARLVRLAWSWCGDPVLAEDLVQGAYDRAVRATGSLRDVDRAEAWIVRIMHRVYLDHLKSAVRREQSFDPADERGALAGLPASDSSSPELAASDGERRRLVREAVASLPLGQRQV